MPKARWLDADGMCGQPRWLDGGLDGGLDGWLDGALMAPRWLDVGAQLTLSSTVSSLPSSLAC